jgi:hypothetical protein
MTGVCALLAVQTRVLPSNSEGQSRKPEAFAIQWRIGNKLRTLDDIEVGDA